MMRAKGHAVRAYAFQQKVVLGSPHLYRAISASRGDALAIGGPGQRIDRYGNAGSPFLYKSIHILVTIACMNELPVGHDYGMTPIGEDATSPR